MLDALRLFAVTVAWGLVGAIGLHQTGLGAYPALLFLLWWLGWLGIVLS